MPAALLTSEVVAMSQSTKIGKTTERGLSPQIMVGVMLVIFVTDKITIETSFCDVFIVDA